jgi:hypothetical protein
MSRLLRIAKGTGVSSLPKQFAKNRRPRSKVFMKLALEVLKLRVSPTPLGSSKVNAFLDRRGSIVSIDRPFASLCRERA